MAKGVNRKKVRQVLFKKRLGDAYFQDPDTMQSVDEKRVALNEYVIIKV